MKKHGCNGQILFSLCGLEEILGKSSWKHWGNFNHICLDWSLGGRPEKLLVKFCFYKKTWLKWVQFIFTLWTRRDSFNFFFSETFEANMAIFWDFFRLCKLEQILWKSSHKPLGWFFKWLTSLMYYYYVYITMIVYFLTDVMKWLRGKWNQLMKLVIPVWSSIGQDFCVPSMHNREFKFGYQHFLLCQKSFLNSLPNDKILDQSKLKAFADDKIDCWNDDLYLWYGRKHCGKRRKCWLPAFSPFPTVFSKAFFLRVVKSRDCVVKS